MEIKGKVIAVAAASGRVLGERFAAAVGGMLEPQQLAQTVVETLTEERFRCLPHPKVLTYIRSKTDDYDQLAGWHAAFA